MTLAQLKSGLSVVHRSIIRATNTPCMLNSLLNEMLELFQAERAWLIPYDEKHCHDLKTVAEAHIANSQALASNARYDHHIRQLIGDNINTTMLLNVNCTHMNTHCELSKIYAVKTQISLIINIDNQAAWIVGLHFCIQQRELSPNETILLEEIGHRIGEAMQLLGKSNLLQNTEAKFQSLIETMSQGVISQDNNGNIIDINHAAEELLGVDKNELMSLHISGYWGSPIYDDGTAIPPKEHPALRCLATHQTVNNMQMGIYNPKTKTYNWLMVNSAPLATNHDKHPTQVVSTLTDITELKHANTSINNHLNHLKTMDRINKITAQSDMIDDMLEKVLDEILDIFDCDRAWFLYPCDPDAPTWNVPMQRTRPAWPGAESNISFETTPDIADMFRTLLASPSAMIATTITYPGITLHEDMRKYHIKTQMLISLFPMADKPWVLGIHYCESLRQISDETKKLFEEIRSQITHSLTSLISLKNLKESEERFRTLVEHAPEAIFVLDVASGCFVDVNENAIALFGRSREDLLSRNCMSMSPTLQPCGNISEQIGYTFINKAIDGETPVFEWTITRGSGELILCEVRLVRLPASEKTLIRGSMTNITARKLADAQMHKLSSALEQTADAVMITDTNGNIEYVNAAFKKITGYDTSESIGKTPRILCSGEHDIAFYKSLWSIIKSGRVFNDVMINRKKDGSLYYEEKSITPLLSPQGEITHLISTGRDITERMETQERLHYLAHHDILTKLPNRALFMDRLTHAIGEAARFQKTVAVLFFDLDNFKMINDTLGHDTGDAALKIVAQLFTKSLHTTDTIARFGGDEFAVIIESIANTREITQTVQNIFQSLTKPVHINGYEIFLATSIGITLFPNDATDASTLIKNADIAMYRAKELGRNNYEFYSTEMSTKVYERLSLETKLRHALEREEFLLHYQPIINTVTGKIIAAEALLRWQPPNENIIGPTNFISALEDTRLINPVGDWVLMTAGAQLKKWNSKLKVPICISVNLSTKQFNAHLVNSTLTKIIDELQLEPHLMKLEITESLLLDSSTQTIELLNRISAMGYCLSIDDFGTGYSSLSYLKRLPIDTLKIDRSFVQDINKDPDDTAIINAIIAMAQSLKLEIIAEGVETKAQLDFLKEKQCNIVQGYYFHKPMSAEDFESLIFQE